MSDFKRIKLKYLVEIPIQTGASEASNFYDTRQYRYIRISDFDEDGKIREEKKVSCPKIGNEKYELVKGDLLYAVTGATVGKSLVFDIDEPSCYAGYLARVRTNKSVLNNYFLFYFSQSADFDKWRKSHINVSTIENIGARNYSNMEVRLPSIPQQEIIVSFLENKTKLIDALINSQSQQIEKLKEYKQSVISNAVTKGLNSDEPMKDSAIEWIGKIPVGWEVKPLKNIFSIKRGSLDKNLNENEVSVKLVQYTAIYNNSKLETREPLLNITATRKEISDASVNYGDLLMTASSETADDIGHTSLISLTDDDLVFGSDVIRLKTNDIDFEYRQYILENKYHLDMLTSYCRGITRFRFSMDDFGKHKWIVPSKEDQIKIAKHLNLVSSNVISLIEQKNQKIEKLQEYKKSLIYEYVTGKKEVA
jgi:type I restriction enzyme S subunit